jgi:hypothetical protein
MIKHLIKTLIVTAGVAAVPTLSNGAGTPVSDRSVSLSQEPLVMRLHKDEFRIAFGINAERCAANGCNGVIRYRVDWKTEDGTTRSEIKRVSYTVSPSSSRALTVDRQYFDTAEGAHTTEVVKVSVDMITCVGAGASRVSRTASTAAPRS